MIRSYVITAMVTGANGAAVGSEKTKRPVNGRVLAIHRAYTTQPNTCDLTVTADSPAATLLTVADSATSGWSYPRVLMDGVDGADLTGVYEPFAVDGYVSIAVAQGNAGSVTVTLLVEE